MMHASFESTSRRAACAACRYRTGGTQRSSPRPTAFPLNDGPSCGRRTSCGGRQLRGRPPRTQARLSPAPSVRLRLSVQGWAVKWALEAVHVHAGRRSGSGAPRRPCLSRSTTRRAAGRRHDGDGVVPGNGQGGVAAARSFRAVHAGVAAALCGEPAAAHRLRWGGRASGTEVTRVQWPPRRARAACGSCA